MPELEMMIAITDRGRCEKFVELYNDNGAPMTMLAFGRGTATSETLDMLGLEAAEKAVIFTVAPREKRRELVKLIKRELYIGMPGNGIVLSVPVSSVAVSSVLRYLTEEQETEGVKKTMEEKREFDYELVVAITNEGCTDLVMDLAREAGANGGTAIHAKGTNVEHARRFFGVSIASEKEMVFIVVPAEQKKPVMKSIAKGAGMQTPSKTVVFSVPVSSIAGMFLPEEDD